jgi:hypothetical protein
MVCVGHNRLERCGKVKGGLMYFCTVDDYQVSWCRSVCIPESSQQQQLILTINHCFHQRYCLAAYLACFHGSFAPLGP